ncbi:talin rod domain-containing protein 1-like [Lytechinus variegatus]|uniref:talin rod domain-containing protein 1-like n=1 Tax=Lytechinus variegatus TaxID=7654 RepID=UPI001BB264CB|nr:talin rod domain-containing protein 1-like [Lytechinus variegatus]
MCECWCSPNSKVCIMAVSSNDLFGPSSVGVVCDLCTFRMQSYADLFLLTRDIRPVNTEGVSLIGESYSKCRDTLIARTKGLAIAAREVRAQLVMGRLKEAANAMKQLSDLVVHITECSSHAAYLAAINDPGSKQAVPGIIDRYKISCAKLNIEHACMTLQHTPLVELSPSDIVDLSADVARELGVLTSASLLASEASDDVFHKEQFKLSMKSVTACTSSLLASIKRYKVTLDERSRARCITFCKPLVQSCQAFVDYASEPEHLGTIADISENGKQVQTAILGGGMSVASSCIQLCHCTRAAAFDYNNPDLIQRLTVCCTAVMDGATLLAQALRDRSSPRTIPPSASCPHLNHAE